jgi:alpha-tubulin suppressor-like RCC1 family protein
MKRLIKIAQVIAFAIIAVMLGSCAARADYEKCTLVQIDPSWFYQQTIAALAVSDSRSFVILADGSLWGWRNRGGYGSPIAEGERTDNTIPTRMLDNVKLVSAGILHSLVANADGTLYMWGSY